MYLRLTALVAFLSTPLLALAQTSSNPNPFINPPGGYAATAGTPLDLKWTPTTDGTVSLVLRSGASNDLEQGVTIASHIANDGDFTWIPADNLPRGSDYTVEIVDDADPALTNYTPYFVLESTNTLPSTTATSGSVSTTTATGSPTGESSATARTVTTMLSSDSSTGTALMSGTATTGGLTTGASFQPTTATAASSSQGSAARATAMAGMLGVVALGAFAL